MREYSIRLVFMDLETRIESDKTYPIKADNNADAVTKVLNSLSTEERDSFYEVSVCHFK